MEMMQNNNNDKYNYSGVRINNMFTSFNVIVQITLIRVETT